MRDHTEGQPLDRRVFLRNGIISSGAPLDGSEMLRGADEKESKETEIGPPEDLMRVAGIEEPFGIYELAQFTSET